MTTGRTIRHRRIQLGFTQAALARASGIPAPAMCAIEHDKVVLGLKRATRVARVLLCHPFDLIHPGPIVSASPLRSKRDKQRLQQAAEDKADLRDIRKRRHEKTIPWEVVRRRLGL